MRGALIGLFIFLNTLYGCEKRTISPSEAHAIADHRYLAQINASGIKLTHIPKPKIDNELDSITFEYVEPTSKRRITVIVGSHGELADTIESAK
jgi:hypothetical protein